MIFIKQLHILFIYLNLSALRFAVYEVVANADYSFVFISPHTSGINGGVQAALHCSADRRPSTADNFKFGFELI